MMHDSEKNSTWGLSFVGAFNVYEESKRIPHINNINT